MDSVRVLRDASRAAWEAPRRLLHALRRDRLLLLVRRRRPVSLLFVCHANLCRSPYAARVMSKLLPPALRGVIPIESAGFAGPGRTPPAEAVAIASGRGVDLSSHRSKVLAPAIVNGSDLVWVMEPAQRREVCARYGRSARRVLVLGDLDPRLTLSRAIQDPFGQPREAYVATYDRIDRCLKELVRAVVAATPRG
jgi:protein-tyrosine phosphatase